MVGRVVDDPALDLEVQQGQGAAVLAPDGVGRAGGQGEYYQGDETQILHARHDFPSTEDDGCFVYAGRDDFPCFSSASDWQGINEETAYVEVRGCGRGDL